jgi:hypothetical protein
MSTTGIHTETTLRARHQEALDIFHAWAGRHRVAGGNEAAAIEIQMNEAWDWVEQTAKDLHLFRQVTRNKPGHLSRRANAA